MAFYSSGLSLPCKWKICKTDCKFPPAAYMCMCMCFFFCIFVYDYKNVQTSRCTYTDSRMLLVTCRLDIHVDVCNVNTTCSNSFFSLFHSITDRIELLVHVYSVRWFCNQLNSCRYFVSYLSFCLEHQMSDFLVKNIKWLTCTMYVYMYLHNSKLFNN